MESKEIELSISDIEGISLRKRYDIKKFNPPNQLEDILKNFTEEVLRIEKYRKQVQSGN